MPMCVPLAQRNLDHGYGLIMDIANPQPPSYGEHLSIEERASLFALETSEITAVRQWLWEAGITRKHHLLSPKKGFLKLNVTIEELEPLLQTEYRVFGYSETGEEHIGCDEHILPGSIRPQIDCHTTVSPRRLKSSVRKRKKPNNAAQALLKTAEYTNFDSPESADDLSTCDALVTSACIRAADGISLGITAVPGNELGIFESGDFYDQQVLDDLFTNVAPWAPQNTQPKLDSIDCGDAPLDIAYGGGSESVLDFELANLLVYYPGTILPQVDDHNERSPDHPGIGVAFSDALEKSF